MKQSELPFWPEKIRQFCSDCRFNSPATNETIHTAEVSLAVRFPHELKTLLAESNGVFGQYDLGLIWPIEQIVQDNLDFRANPDFQLLYMPFDQLMFFADAGNGDQFAYSILAGEIRRSDIFAWNHENDSRTWVAPSLSKYLEWWHSGKIKL